MPRTRPKGAQRLRHDSLDDSLGEGGSVELRGSIGPRISSGMADQLELATPRSTRAPRIRWRTRGVLGAARSDCSWRTVMRLVVAVGSCAVGITALIHAGRGIGRKSFPLDALISGRAADADSPPPPPPATHGNHDSSGGMAAALALDAPLISPPVIPPAPGPPHAPPPRTPPCTPSPKPSIPPPQPPQPSPPPRSPLPMPQRPPPTPPSMPSPWPWPPPPAPPLHSYNTITPLNVSMSSTYDAAHAASLCFDGDPDTFCATARERGGWVAMRLPLGSQIGYVQVLNRNDVCPHPSTPPPLHPSAPASHSTPHGRVSRMVSRVVSRVRVRSGSSISNTSSRLRSWSGPPARLASSQTLSGASR